MEKEKYFLVESWIEQDYWAVAEVIAVGTAEEIDAAVKTLKPTGAQYYIQKGTGKAAVKTRVEWNHGCPDPDYRKLF